MKQHKFKTETGIEVLAQEVNTDAIILNKENHPSLKDAVVVAKNNYGYGEEDYEIGDVCVTNSFGIISLGSDVEVKGAYSHKLPKVIMAFPNSTILGTADKDGLSFDPEGLVEDGGYSAVAGKYTSVKHYQNYKYGDWRFPFTDKNDSFLSLLNREGVVFVNPLGRMPTFTGDPGYENRESYAELHNWKFAESKLWIKALLIRIDK